MPGRVMGLRPPGRTFAVDQGSLSTLKEMGFSEEDCIVALQVTNNNLEHSVTFLMNNPNPASAMNVSVAPISESNRPMTGLSVSSSGSQNVNSGDNNPGYATRLAA